jgi:hypothetical protein
MLFQIISNPWFVQESATAAAPYLPPGRAFNPRPQPNLKAGIERAVTVVASLTFKMTREIRALL